MNRMLGAFLSSALLAAALPALAGGPETVKVTYHVRAGKLDEFLKVLKAHHPTCLKLGLVKPQPHLILKGEEEDGKPWVVEILTWRDEEAPDSVSAKYPQVQAIWDQLNALVETRGGRRAIEIEVADIVVEAKGASK